MYFAHIPGRIILGFGVGCWTVGVLLKWAAYHLLVLRYLHGRLPAVLLVVIQGVLSASTELGATTVLLMMLPRLRLSEAFGIGAGAAFVEGVVMEVVEVQKGTPHGQHVAEQVEASLANRFVPAFLSIADRLVASVAHVCSRALIFLSVRTGNPVPALTAFITFAAIDGYAGYALGQKWSFGKLPVALKVYGPMAGLATVQGFVLLAVL